MLRLFIPIIFLIVFIGWFLYRLLIKKDLRKNLHSIYLRLFSFNKEYGSSEETSRSSYSTSSDAGSYTPPIIDTTDYSGSGDSGSYDSGSSYDSESSSSSDFSFGGGEGGGGGSSGDW